MNFTPSPLQTLVLFQLVFTGQEPKQSELSQLKPKPRKELIDAGFIELEKRGRAQHILLTDRAWEWVADNLEADISRRAKSTDAFLGLLSRLSDYLRTHNVPLAEFVQSAFLSDALGKLQKDTGAMLDRIRSAYLSLSGGRFGVRVRLKDLRSKLPAISHEALSQALLDFQDQGKLILMHLDDPQERKPADDAAAVDILGHKRHILYMEA